MKTETAPRIPSLPFVNFVEVGLSEATPTAAQWKAASALPVAADPSALRLTESKAFEGHRVLEVLTGRTRVYIGEDGAVLGTDGPGAKARKLIAAVMA